jgi:hypothetical protein
VRDSGHLRRGYSRTYCGTEAEARGLALKINAAIAAPWPTDPPGPSAIDGPRFARATKFAGYGPLDDGRWLVEAKVPPKVFASLAELPLAAVKGYVKG